VLEQRLRWRIGGVGVSKEVVGGVFGYGSKKGTQIC